MQNSENVYRHIRENPTDYVYTVYVENGCPVGTTHSETCLDVTGYSRQEFQDNPYLWIMMVVEEDRHAVRTQAEQTLAMQSSPAIRHRIIRKDGSVRWVESSIFPNHGPDGSLTSYNGVIRDITGQKSVEERLSNIDRLIEEADELMHRGEKNRSDDNTARDPSCRKTENRSYKRINAGNKCRVQIGDIENMELKDISLGGVGLKTLRRLPVESYHQVRIVSDRTGEINSTGVVVWVSPNGEKRNGSVIYEAGLKFNGLGSRFKSSLGELIINLTG